jgi:hypothetical protein
VKLSEFDKLRWNTLRLYEVSIIVKLTNCLPDDDEDQCLRFPSHLVTALDAEEAIAKTKKLYRGSSKEWLRVVQVVEKERGIVA